ncbi:hypothetical protein Hanom_Chr07g00621071 [Helianthus anomalus]
MGEIMEFENAKKSFVADAEEKLSQEKELNANRQRDSTAACERSNRELKAARDEVVKVEAEKAKEVQYPEEEQGSGARIAELVKIVAEQQAQNKTLDLLAQDLGNDCMWLLTRGVPLIVDHFMRSKELAKYMLDLGGAAYDSGRKNGYAEGSSSRKGER